MTTTATTTEEWNRAALEHGLRIRLATTWLHGLGAGGAIPEWIDALVPRVAEIIGEHRAEALRDAARDLEQWGDPACTISTWLRARAAGCNCGAPGICQACGAVLCAECNVGEPSRCDHGNGPLCVGCDVDACAGCAHDLLPVTGLQSATWRDR